MFVDDCDFSSAHVMTRAGASGKPATELGIFKEFSVETRVSVTFTAAPSDDDGTLEWVVLYVIE